HAGAHLAADLADQRAVARQNQRRLRKLHELPGLAGAVGSVLSTEARCAGERSRGERAGEPSERAAPGKRRAPGGMADNETVLQGGHATNGGSCTTRENIRRLRAGP